MEEENYWTRALRRRISRRNLLRTGALTGVGLASLYAAGCGENQQAKSGVTPAATTPAGSTAAAATPTPAATPKYGGVVNIIADDPLGWDPQGATSNKTQNAIGLIYNRCFEFQQGEKGDPTDLEPIPSLVEKWEQPDDVTFIFSVRQGVKWQNKAPVNGRLFDAEDIKYTIERMKDNPAFTYRYMFDPVTKIEVPSSDKAKFTLGEPFAPLIANMANYHVWMLAKEVAEKGAEYKKPEWAIGTGPFMLESYEPNVKAIYKKNPDFFMKGMPYVDGVTSWVMNDPSTQIASLRSGKLEVTTVDPAQVETVKRTNPEFKWEEYVANGGNYILYRNDKAPFNDVRVRRAISLAMDRKSWLDAFHRGKGFIDNGPPLPATFNYFWKLPTDQLGPGAQWYKYDVAAAKKLLAEAGYPNGLSVSMHTTSGYGPAFLDQSEAAKDFLSKGGINAAITVREYAEFIADVHDAAYPEMAYGALTPVVEIDEWTFGMHHSTKGGANKGAVRDKTLDPMLEKQRTQYNKTERKKTIDDIQKYIADQCYYFFCPVGPVYTAWQPYLKGYRPHIGWDRGNMYRQVWIDKS